MQHATSNHGHSTPLEQVLNKLPGHRRSGTGWIAHCPAHDDKQRSLSVTEGEDGRVLLHCFASCDAADIAHALGLDVRDLFPRSERPKKPATTRRQIVARYPYRDEHGQLLYEAVRFAPKGFSQRQPDGQGGWISDLAGTRRVLYRLPELLTSGSRWVFVVEGEKDADRLAGLKLVATTAAMGASAPWLSEYTAVLAGRHVAILPDNDEAGSKHAQKIAAAIHDTAASVRVVVLPGLPAKGDVSDWLDNGSTRSELERLIREAEPWASGMATATGQGPDTSSATSDPGPFPIEALPEPIRRFVTIGAAALDVAPEFIAVPFFAFVGGTIGNRLRIELKPGWEQPSTPWTAVVGGPGTGKSPALNYARAPFERLQSEALEVFRCALRHWEEQMTAARSGKTDGTAPERPREQTYYVSDATFESLAPLLEVSPGLALYRDELVGWVRSHDQYRSGGDRQSWLSLWAATQLKINRRTAATIFVAHPVVSVVGGIQPDLLPDLAAERNRADGFLDRFLWAYPPAHYPAWTDDFVETRVVEDVTTLCRLLRPQSAPDPAVVVLTSDARAAFREWFDDNQALIREAIGLAAGAYAKLPNQLARLALILHTLKRPEDPVCPVSAETMLDSIALVEWFRDQLGRVLPLLGAERVPRGAGLVARITAILNRTPGAWLSRSEISDALGGHTSSDEISAALNRLAADRKAETRTVATGKRPREEWRSMSAEIRKMRNYGHASPDNSVFPVSSQASPTNADNPVSSVEPPTAITESNDEYEEFAL